MKLINILNLKKDMVFLIQKKGKYRGIYVKFLNLYKRTPTFIQMMVQNTPWREIKEIIKRNWLFIYFEITTKGTSSGIIYIYMDIEKYINEKTLI